MSVIKEGVTISFMGGVVKLTGDIEYLASKDALIFHPVGEPEEVLTVNLEAYNLSPGEGCVFLRDYSQHEGLFASLAEAGVIEPQPVRVYSRGPHGARFYETRISA
ncbi:hypothetical protein [Nocardiopsis synnemataformans]|uniref:hypothetical protein n=1 Tax=Nocardiopsis synnemataformans TaxID=61305 RepID=UPI003EBEFEFA